MLSALRVAARAAAAGLGSSSTAIGPSSSAAAARAASAAAASTSGGGASARPFAVTGLRWLSSPQAAGSVEAQAAASGSGEASGAAAASPAAAPARPSTPGGRSRQSASPPRRAPPRPPPGTPPPPPWTPTAALAKRKFLPRRMAHLMQTLEAEREAASTAARPLPDFRPGDALEVRLAIAENRGRPATLRGVCIARRAAGWRSSLTLLSHIPGGGVVTRAVPLHSPALQEVRVLERARVKARRAKLYYLARRNPKEWRV